MTHVPTDDSFFAALIDGLSEAVLVSEPGKPHYVYATTGRTVRAASSPSSPRDGQCSPWGRPAAKLIERPT